MNTSVRPGDPTAPGTVGVPLDVVELRLVDDATEVMDGTWFRTGDTAVLAPEGRVRPVGRRGTDLIKSGRYAIGTGEIENTPLAHPGVAEALPRNDMGKVPSGSSGACRRVRVRRARTRHPLRARRPPRTRARRSGRRCRR